MTHLVRVHVDGGDPEAGDAAASGVVFDPDDPHSVERARWKLSQMLHGHSVPPLCGPDRRSWTGFLRRLLPAFR